MKRVPASRSRALAALLLFLLLALPSCDLSRLTTQNASSSAQHTTQNGGQIEKAARGKIAVGGGKNQTGTASERSTAFVHHATKENSSGDYTYISNPRLDGNPDAIVFVKPTDASGNGGTYDHNIGVWYEPKARKWAIFNQDRAPVPAGSTFEVTVPPKSESFVHHSGPDNTSDDSTYLDDPLVNAKPDVSLTITQDWNPGGGDGTYNDHPVAARYDAGRERWAIYNQDGAAMPNGAAFNVTVSQENQMASVDAAKAQSDAKTPADVPKYRSFYSKGNPKVPQKLIPEGSSAGAIPVVQPFNFGRDPGGPKDKTLSLNIPKIGVKDIPVFDSVSPDKLRDGTVHIPATGYPWQQGANVYIAGHRIGFPGTPSNYVFYRLNELQKGDEIELTDADGRRYVYKVTRQTVVSPNSVDVMNAVKGKSLVTLQTCTLPNFKDRLIVQGELVRSGGS